MGPQWTGNGRDAARDGATAAVVTAANDAAATGDAACPTYPPDAHGAHMAWQSPAEQASLAAVLDRMSRQRYGGTDREDALIEQFTSVGAARVSTDMALAARAALPGDVMHHNAVMDMRLQRIHPRAQVQHDAEAPS